MTMALNEAKAETESDDTKQTPNTHISPSNIRIISDPCTSEEVIIIGDALEDDDSYQPYPDPPADDSWALTAPPEDAPDKQPSEQRQPPSEDALLAAWWDYKRRTEKKKKKRKKNSNNVAMTFYRDENLWSSDRFTDDEDFTHYDDP